MMYIQQYVIHCAVPSFYGGRQNSRILTALTSRQALTKKGLASRNKVPPFYVPSDIPLPRQFFFVFYIFRIRCTKPNSASSSSSVSYLSTIQTHILPPFPFSSPSTLYSCLSPPPFSPLPPPPLLCGPSQCEDRAYSGLCLFRP